MATESRLRWDESEWMNVIGATLPLIAKGSSKVDALDKAQRKVLPRVRYRDRVSLGKLCTPSNGGFDAAVARFKALPAAERATYSPAPPPAASPKAVPPKAELEAGNVRWTSRERALMAADVELLRREPGYTELLLQHLYIKAQPMILPADRQRAEGGIKQSAYAGQLQRAHEDGLANGWQYPETQDPFRLGTTATPAAAPAPVDPVPEPPAPLPESEPSEIAAAVAAFGASMMDGLARLLTARDASLSQQMSEQASQHMTTQAQALQSVVEQVTTLPDRIGPLVAELLQTQVARVAEEVTQRVRAMLLEELGGPSTPSPPATSSPAPTQAANGPRERVLRIDVLGTVAPDWMARIREAISEADELRFIDFDSAREFAPHRGRHLILMQQGKIPRVLQQKLEATGVKPLVVRDAGGHVLRAVQDLKSGAATSVGATLQ